MTASWLEVFWLTPSVAISVLIAGAIAAMLCPNRRVAWTLTLMAVVAALVVVGGASGLALSGRQLATGWLVLDGVALLTAPLFVAVSVAALLLEGARAEQSRAGALSASLHLTTAAGWLGALFARDWIAVLLCTQLGWISATALAALSAERGSLNGALRMLSAGGIGAAFMTLGAALIIRATGAASIAELSGSVVDAPQMASLGIMLMVTPLLAMAGAAPLYTWAGAAYGRAAAAPVVLAASIGALALIIRIAAATATAPAIAENVAAALVALGLASVLVGSFQAVGATNTRRLVAYAGAVQVGCVLVAIALGSPAALAAAFVQTIALAASGFAVLAGAASSRDAAAVGLDGLGRRAPLSGVALTAGALCWMGAPLTIGFLGRWRLIEAGVGAGWWWATGAAIVASLAAVFYGGRLIERVYFRRANEQSALDRDPWRWLRAPVLVVAIAAIASGVAPGGLLEIAGRSAEQALGLAP